MGEARGIRAVVASASLVAALALGGCSVEPYPEIPRFAESGGQTQAQLDATLATITGLEFTSASGSQPNVKGNTGYRFRMILDPAYRIADAAALVDFLVESAWSVRDGYMPNTTIALELVGVPDDAVDLVTVAEDAGWVPEGSQTSRGVAANGLTSVSVWVDTEAQFAKKRGAIANRERLGDWPGTVPQLPADVVVPRTDLP